MTIQKLDGCIVSTLANYLKTMGAFRIIAEQKDGATLGRWNNDRFEIDTMLDREEIIDFILNRYEPSPLISPWSWNKYQKTKEMISDIIEHDRFRRYKKVLESMDMVETAFCGIHNLKSISKKAIEDDKIDMVRLCRNLLPDEIIPWIDAVCVINNDERAEFAPIMGTGGNDGNFDIAENFVKQLNALFFPKKGSKSKEWLESSLYGEPTDLTVLKMVGLNPPAGPSPVGGQGFKSKSISNP